jgi:hypothetical protein
LNKDDRESSLYRKSQCPKTALTLEYQLSPDIPVKPGMPLLVTTEAQTEKDFAICLQQAVSKPQKSINRQLSADLFTEISETPGIQSIGKALRHKREIIL